MDINLRLEELEKLILTQGKDIEVLKEIVSKVKNKLLVSQRAILDSEEEFEALKILLNSDAWPQAVEQNLICNITSDQDKQDRAEGILNIVIDVHLEKLRFLDFGCGEGHVVNQSLKQNPQTSIGYDIVESQQWAKFEKTTQSIYTTKWEEVEKNGPYKVVLLYDVIDHMKEETLVDNLRNLHKVLAPNAKIYVRCHPWVSRHATHLYNKINKAFIHLVFSKQELEKLSCDGSLPTIENIHPLAYYSNKFNLAGLSSLKKEKTITASVESFFSTTPLVAKRIKKNWSKSNDAELRDGRKFPWQLEFQFIDYILGAK